MLKELKRLRKERNLTTRQMGYLLGVSGSYYSQIENEKRNLSYRNALRIARIFRLKPDLIFYDDIKER